MNKSYSVAEQFSALRTKYPSSTGGLHANSFTWNFSSCPTPLSDVYTIKIQYCQGCHPNVFVVSPQPLTKALGARVLPHTYNTRKQHLCLYNRNWNEWNSSMLIADTIVHWAILWLCYYEDWAFTGIWKGGGHGDWDVNPKTSEKERAS